MLVDIRCAYERVRHSTSFPANFLRTDYADVPIFTFNVDDHLPTSQGNTSPNVMFSRPYASIAQGRVRTLAMLQKPCGLSEVASGQGAH